MSKRISFGFFTNYKKKLEIQNIIFYKEDATINILVLLDRNIFMKKTGIKYVDDNVKYYKENL